MARCDGGDTAAARVDGRGVVCPRPPPHLEWDLRKISATIGKRRTPASETTPTTRDANRTLKPTATRRSKPHEQVQSPDIRKEPKN